jgi:biopolymer transport protein ExbB/TolQ
VSDLEKISGKFEKFFDGMYGRHDENQVKHSKWMNQKEKDLRDLEKSAGRFEKRMEQTANEAERWMTAQEKHLKS